MKTVIKSRRLRWMKAAHKGNMKNVYKIIVRKN
jgi:hypothetical protein